MIAYPRPDVTAHSLAACASGPTPLKSGWGHRTCVTARSPEQEAAIRAEPEPRAAPKESHSVPGERGQLMIIFLAGRRKLREGSMNTALSALDLPGGAIAQGVQWAPVIRGTQSA